MSTRINRQPLFLTWTLSFLLLLAASPTLVQAGQWRCADGTLCVPCTRDLERSLWLAVPDHDECAVATATDGDCHDCCRFVSPNVPLFGKRGNVRPAAMADSALAVPARPTETRPLFAPRIVVEGPGAPRPVPRPTSSHSCPPRGPPLLVA